MLIPVTGLRKIILDDSLIQQFAAHELVQQGDSNIRRPNSHNLVRQKMRSVANILCESQKKDNTISSMMDLISPGNFKAFIAACKKVAVENNQQGKTLGGYFRRIILLKISMAIEKESADQQREAEQFRYLMDAHFLSQVSGPAAKRQRMKNIAKADDIPLADDMKKFSDYLKKEISEVTDVSSDAQSARLSKLLLAYLIHFNKRRPMEVAEITTQAFISEALREIHDNKEIIDSLTFSEQVLAKRLVAQIQTPSLYTYLHN